MDGRTVALSILFLRQLFNVGILISLGRVQNLVPGVSLCIAIVDVDQGEMGRRASAICATCTIGPTS